MDDGVDMRVVLTNVYSDARSIAITQAHPYVSARHLDRGLTRNQLNKRQMTSGVTFWLVPPPTLSRIRPRTGLCHWSRSLIPSLRTRTHAATPAQLACGLSGHMRLAFARVAISVSWRRPQKRDRLITGGAGDERFDLTAGRAAVIIVGVAVIAGLARLEDAVAAREVFESGSARRSRRGCACCRHRIARRLP